MPIEVKRSEQPIREIVYRATPASVNALIARSNRSYGQRSLWVFGTSLGPASTDRIGVTMTPGDARDFGQAMINWAQENGA